jgi:hypothetical protein
MEQEDPAPGWRYRQAVVAQLSKGQTSSNHPLRVTAPPRRTRKVASRRRGAGRRPVSRTGKCSTGTPPSLQPTPATDPPRWVRLRGRGSAASFGHFLRGDGWAKAGPLGVAPWARLRSAARLERRFCAGASIGELADRDDQPWAVARRWVRGRGKTSRDGHPGCGADREPRTACTASGSASLRLRRG